MEVKPRLNMVNLKILFCLEKEFKKKKKKLQNVSPQVLI